MQKKIVFSRNTIIFVRIIKNMLFRSNISKIEIFAHNYSKT